MPTKNFLSPEEKNYLQQALKKETRPEVRERILRFLLENDGKNYQASSRILRMLSENSSLLGSPW